MFGDQPKEYKNNTINETRTLLISYLFGGVEAAAADRKVCF